MRELLEHLKTIREAANVEKRVYELEGTPNSLDAVEKFLATIQEWGMVGHSGVVEFSADGDGAFRLKVVNHELKGKVVSDDVPGGKAKIGAD